MRFLMTQTRVMIRALSILIRDPRLAARYVQNLEYPHGVRVERVEFGTHASITAFYRFFKNSGHERQCQIGVLGQNTSAQLETGIPVNL
jgi:hypothetical protein